MHEEDNPLFNRKEVRFEVVHEGGPTPSLNDIRIALAQKTGSEVMKVVIDSFKTLFGIGRTVGNARIYRELSDLKDYEPLYLLKRNKLVAEEKKEETPAAAPKPEVKAETPSEAKK